MKIAIITSGILPVPAVQGGAVENLIDFYLEYNDIHQLHDITIYSAYNPRTSTHPALSSTINHYTYIDLSSIKAKIKKRIYRFFHKYEYYHYSIEYFFEKVKKQIISKDFDIIIIENRPGFCLKLQGITKARIIVHQHTDTLTISTNKHQEIFDAAYRFITVSNYIADRIRTINHLEDKCITVYNGINLKNFSPNKKHIISRNDIGLSNDDFVLVYSGRIMPQKGIIELIDAISILKNINIKLLIIGSPFYAIDKEEDIFFKELRKRAKPIEAQIVFTGFIEYSIIPDYLFLADVAIVPSRLNDAFPTTILEAEAMGLPIVSTNRGGITEQVDEKNAIIVPDNENIVNSLAKSINILYSDPYRRERMKKASLLRAKFFSKERFARDFFEAIKS